MTNEQYYELIQPYQSALQLLMTRLDTLKKSLYAVSDGKPVHNFQSRIKSKQSIEDKLARKGRELSVANAKAFLQDIAGIRVICYFADDIYRLSAGLKRQTDLIVMRETDYIAAPKQNGYRSYHIVIGVPVYYLDTMEYFPVEVQLRTMAMDLWASMEHRILYKKEHSDRERIAAELRKDAELLAQLERQLERFGDGRPGAR